MDQVTCTSPRLISSPRAAHTPSDPSTMLFAQPSAESHSSTTLANTLLPLGAVILIIFPHRDPPSYHRVGNATMRSELSWYLPSHSDGPPPSPHFSKLLLVRMAGVEEETGGEGVLELPPHMWVPTSGSSLHLPLMHMSWPSQSSSVWHEPPQEDMPNARNGRDKILDTSHTDANHTTAEFAIAIWSCS